jgi:hypothetical protein
MQNGCGLTFDFIKDNLFGTSNIPRGQLRQRIKQVANFERGNSGIWSLKSLGEDNFPGVEALGRKVRSPSVCRFHLPSRCEDLTSVLLSVCRYHQRESPHTRVNAPQLDDCKTLV